MKRSGSRLPADLTLAEGIAAEYFSPNLGIEADGWQVDAFQGVLSDLGVDPNITLADARRWTPENVE